MIRILAALLLLPVVAFAEPAVRLPLADYDRMKEEIRKADEAPKGEEEKESGTTVEQVRFSGSFAKGDITVILKGQTTGQMTAISVLRVTDPSVRLHDCAGDGLLTRSGDSYSIAPQAQHFSFRCRVSAVTSEALELATTAAAPWVESEVSDAEFISNENGDGGVHIKLVRTTQASTEPVPLTAVGRYSIKLMPDGARFNYRLEVHNPNRIRTSFAVTFRSGEHISRVAAKADYVGIGAHYTFELPPGDTTILATGTLTDGSFTPPLDASAQYVLLESHPVLRPIMLGSPTRISIPETGLSAEFRGAEGYLLGKGEGLKWETTRLTTIPATGIAVPEAAHTFFISATGEVLGESALNIENQGSSDLTLPVHAKPLYASVAGEPTPLTRNTGGHLWLPLTAGRQWVAMQFRGTLSHSLGLAWGRLWLPQIATPASRSQVDVRYPDNWVPLFERFQSDIRFRNLELRRLLWSVGLAIASALALTTIGLSRRRAFGMGLLLGTGSLASDLLFGIAFVGVLAVVLLRLAAQLRSLGAARVPLAGLAGFLIIYSAVWLRSDGTQKVVPTTSQPAHFWKGPTSGGLAEVGPTTEICNGYDDDCDVFADNVAGTATKIQMGTGWRMPSAVSADARYRGLPARLMMPTGRSLSTFTTEMLRTEQPEGVQVLLVDRRLLAALSTLLTVSVLAMLWRSRTALAPSLRRVAIQAFSPAV